jgi:ABC-type bacteriocin/lantibiotic exporter with double-glycine peptidase domain
VVLAVAIVQVVTSFTTSQLLARGAQRLIADLRKRVQQHILHLPISFYDAHKTGEVVARITNDVDGLRNVVGGGLLDLAGGVLTAVIAAGVLLWISPAMTALAAACIGLFLCALLAALAHVHPIFREKSPGEVPVRVRMGSLRPLCIRTQDGGKLQTLSQHHQGGGADSGSDDRRVFLDVSGNPH